MARVVLDNLTRVFKGARGEDVVAVKDLALTIEDKELVVLVGPSGCGKSTTLRLIAGLEEISQGTVTIDGRAVNHLAPKDRDVALVFQDCALYPHLTVYENLAFGLRLRRRPNLEVARLVGEAAELLGLGPLLDRLPQALSGGQRQRVAVGRAIVRQPKVLLLDEPLASLDPRMRVQMRLELARLHHRLGATMIYVTHDQVEAMTLGDRIVVLQGGAVQQIAGPLELYRRPANLFVAGFIGAPPMNFFPGFVEAEQGRVRFVVGAGQASAPLAGLSLRVPEPQASRLAALTGMPIILGLRPEHIAVAPRGLDAAENVIAATVELVEPVGAETYLYLSAHGAAFVARVPGDQQVAAQQTLSVWLDLSKARFFDAKTERALWTHSDE